MVAEASYMYGEGGNWREAEARIPLAGPAAPLRRPSPPLPRGSVAAVGVHSRWPTARRTTRPTPEVSSQDRTEHRGSRIGGNNGQRFNSQCGDGTAHMVGRTPGYSISNLVYKYVIISTSSVRRTGMEGNLRLEVSLLQYWPFPGQASYIEYCAHISHVAGCSSRPEYNRRTRVRSRARPPDPQRSPCRR